MNPINMMHPSRYEKHINGAVVAMVTNTKDPDGTGRVKVVYPWNTNNGESYWARIMSFYAGEDRGALFLPEVDDEVLVIFEQGDMESPIIIGSLWSSKAKPPETNGDGKNNIKKIRTRSGHEIVFDDSESGAKLEIKSKSGHQITLDDALGGEKVTIQDKTGNSIEMDAVTNKITLKSSMQLSLEANIIDIKADSMLTLQGGIVKIN